MRPDPKSYLISYFLLAFYLLTADADPWVPYEPEGHIKPNHINQVKHLMALIMRYGKLTSKELSTAEDESDGVNDSKSTKAIGRIPKNSKSYANVDRLLSYLAKLNKYYILFGRPR